MKILNLIIYLILILNSSNAFATRLAYFPAFYEVEDKKKLPKNFRDLSALKINAIASGQFSESQLQEIRKKYPEEKITIIDLRQERHGFIDGKAVSWHTPFEMANQHNSTENILSDESRALNQLENNKKTVIFDILKNRDLNTGWYKEISQKTINVTRAISEKELAEEMGFGYKRFPIRDFDIPSQKEFAKIIQFIENLPQDQKIYVHCGAGKGRTGTFLTLLDIAKNGKETELKEILKRQHELGSARLDNISTEESWSEDLARERMKMIENFYKMKLK